MLQNSHFAILLRINRCERGGGEKQVKMIAVLIVALALLMMFAVVAPVFAATKVSAKFTPSKVVTAGGTTNLTPSGIMHVMGAERTGVATLVINSITYVGTIHADLNYDVDPITLTTTQHYQKMTLTFPVQTGLTEEGVFEGVLKWTASYNAPWVGIQSIIPTTMESNGVLQGSGGFEGITLHLITEPPLIQTSWALTH